MSGSGHSRKSGSACGCKKKGVDVKEGMLPVAVGSAGFILNGSVMQGTWKEAYKKHHAPATRRTESPMGDTLGRPHMIAPHETMD